MATKHALPHTIAELITLYDQGTFIDEMRAVDWLLRQLAANWFMVADGENPPSWDYPLTVPCGMFLVRARLTHDDVEYISRITSHVEPADHNLSEAEAEQQAIELATNDQRAQLRAVFANLSRKGSTPAMVNSLRMMLPGDSHGGYVIRPEHLTALRILHLLLLRAGFWPKQLRDAWLNPAEAGYDPTAVPQINETTLALAHINRESKHLTTRSPVNDTVTFAKEVDGGNTGLSAEYLRHSELALMILASLVDPGLAAFSDAYWDYREEIDRF